MYGFVSVYTGIVNQSKERGCCEMCFLQLLQLQTIKLLLTFNDSTAGKSFLSQCISLSVMGDKRNK